MKCQRLLIDSPVPASILYVSVANRNATGAQFSQIVGT